MADIDNPQLEGEPLTPAPGRIPRGVKLLIGALFATSMANRAQLVALGLLVFDVTGNVRDLGLLGLAEFIPIFLLAPFTGTMADRYDRRIVYAVGLGIEMACTVGLFIVARGEPTSIVPILALVLVFGVARAVTAPASRALPIDLAPRGMVERVVALRSVAFQSAGIVGLAARLSDDLLDSFVFDFGVLIFDGLYDCNSCIVDR
jgi:MFS family permease